MINTFRSNATGYTKYAKHKKKLLWRELYQSMRKSRGVISTSSSILLQKLMPRWNSRGRHQEWLQSLQLLFISNQVRDENLDENFMHENHSWPPSLWHHGKRRLPSWKSQLLDLFQPEAPVHFDANLSIYST